MVGVGRGHGIGAIAPTLGQDVLVTRHQTRSLSNSGVLRIAQASATIALSFQSGHYVLARDLAKVWILKQVHIDCCCVNLHC